MSALQWIVKEAKSIKKKFPKRFKTWKEYVAQASAIYASKHKGKSPVGKKRKKKVTGVSTKSKSHTDKNKITANIQVGSTLKLAKKEKVLGMVHKKASKAKKTINEQIGAIKSGSKYIHFHGYQIEKKPIHIGKKKSHLFIIHEFNKVYHNLNDAKRDIKHLCSL